MLTEEGKAVLASAGEAALGLAVLNLALWRVPWFRRFGARRVCYVLGTGTLLLAQAAYAARTGQWAAWRAQVSLTVAAGGTVVGLWAAHAVAEEAEIRRIAGIFGREPLGGRA